MKDIWTGIWKEAGGFAGSLGALVLGQGIIGGAETEWEVYMVYSWGWIFIWAEIRPYVGVVLRDSIWRGRLVLYSRPGMPLI